MRLLVVPANIFMRLGCDLRELLYFALPFCRVIISSSMSHYSSAHTEPQRLYRPYRINGSPKRQLDIPSICYSFRRTTQLHRLSLYIRVIILHVRSRCFQKIH